MSDATHEWLMVTSARTKSPLSGRTQSSVPQRKGPVSDYALTLRRGIDEDGDPIYLKVSRNPMRPPSAPTMVDVRRQKSNYAVAAFGSGVVIFAVGILLLLACIITNNSNVKVGASAFLAAGSVIVALALLRGQDINERNT
jgi:hypothetical protein